MRHTQNRDALSENREEEASWFARPRSCHGVSNDSHKVAVGQAGGSARPGHASLRRLGRVDLSDPHLPLRTPIRTCRGFAGRLVKLCTEGTCSDAEPAQLFAPSYCRALQSAWSMLIGRTQLLSATHFTVRARVLASQALSMASKLLTAAIALTLPLNLFASRGGSPFRY